MKHLKHYEHTIKDRIPQIGDYAIADTRTTNKEFKSFLNNNIGVITHIEVPSTTDTKISYIEDNSIIMRYDNIPTELKCYFDGIYPNSGERTCDIALLKHFSTNKEELNIYIDQNKFNL